MNIHLFGLITGLVDEKEDELLNTMIEHNMKRLWSSPSSVPPSAPHILLGNLIWVLGNKDILTYLYENSELLNFSFGDKICDAGDGASGLYLIVSGMVKIHYAPTAQCVMVKAISCKNLSKRLIEAVASLHTQALTFHCTNRMWRAMGSSQIQSSTWT